MIDLTQDSPPPAKKRRTEATPSGALVHTLARTHNVQEQTIGAVRRLLVDEQRTVPFVARYRAQETQQLPPDALRAILDALHGAAALEAKRQKVLEAMRAANASPEALSAARRAGTLRALDDAYAPFKGPAKCSKAAKAREDFPASDRVVASLLGRGEEPRHLHPKQKECVLLVLADAVAKDPRARQATQRRFIRGTLAAKKGKEPNAEYRFYEGWSRPLRRVAGHAWLALERASKAKALSLTIDPGGDDREAVRDLAQCLGLRDSKFAAPALKDAWTRLLKPRGRREVKRDGLIRAKDEAIVCFASNVKKLLEQAPPLIDDGSVLAVDPGFRHGHKCCIVSGRDGSLQTHFTIDAPGAEDDMKRASTRLDSLVGDHTITCVAIGDGTNTRGAQRLVASTPKLSTVPRAVVRECGASVYSASDAATKEFGENVPLSARGAASLARRLLDPLGEYVKLDPKTLGVGSYQHDLDAKQLRRALDGAVEDAVSGVGVDANGASSALLERVAGLNATLAKALVSSRPFASRNDLKRVKGLGPKTFDNVAGFLRVSNSREVLDATRIHPDDYGEAWRVLKKAGVSSDDVQRAASKGGGLGSAIVEKLRRLPPSSLVDLLCDPCLAGDARYVLAPPPILERGAPLTLRDCNVGRVFAGTVRNVAPFGAFVDIGVGVDGLLHSSQFGSSDRIEIGARVDVAVVEVDEPRRRVGLRLARKPLSASRGPDDGKKRPREDGARERGRRDDKRGRRGGRD